MLCSRVFFLGFGTLLFDTTRRRSGGRSRIEESVYLLLECPDKALVWTAVAPLDGGGSGLNRILEVVRVTSCTLR